MSPSDLLSTAARLLRGGVGRPRQSDLKRAVSTAYYALFHALCRNGADCLIGTSGSARSKPAWQQVYRAVNHGFAKKQFQQNRVMHLFPLGIQVFAGLFVELQVRRLKADYDPASRFSLPDAQILLNYARLAIDQLGHAPMKDRRAFAAWVTVSHRA